MKPRGDKTRVAVLEDLVVGLRSVRCLRKSQTRNGQSTRYEPVSISLSNRIASGLVGQLPAGGLRFPIEADAFQHSANRAFAAADVFADRFDGQSLKSEREHLPLAPLQ